MTSYFDDVGSSKMADKRKWLQNTSSLTKYFKIKVVKDREVSEEELVVCLDQLENERQRRLFQDKESEIRKEVIRGSYMPRHAVVYTLKDKFFSEQFLDLVAYCKEAGAKLETLLKLVHSEKAERTFSFPVFTEEFCELLVEEVEHFEASSSPKGRPNTMNNYGILLDELNFYDTFITPLRENYLNPICQLLYPEWYGSCLDSHKAFIVTYKLGEDRDLSYHYDNAEITLNICLGKSFDEGSLYFGAMRTETTHSEFTECRHRPTYGVLHRGQHMHGAMPIESGERYNLIIWMRSSSIRNVLCPMCDAKPDLLSGQGFADGFKQDTVSVCAVV